MVVLRPAQMQQLCGTLQPSVYFSLALWECEGSTLSRQIELAYKKWRWPKVMSSTSTALPTLFLRQRIRISRDSWSFSQGAATCSSVDVVFACRDGDKNGGFNNDRAKVLPFHVKLLAFAFLWLRYNVNDVLKLIHKCIHRPREQYSRSSRIQVKKH